MVTVIFAGQADLHAVLGFWEIDGQTMLAADAEITVHRPVPQQREVTGS